MRAGDDVAKGINSFTKGMQDDPEDDVKQVERLESEPVDVTPSSERKDA
jgi:hypothetical protein